MKEKVLETIPEFEPVVAPIGQSSSIVLTKTELLDKTICSHEKCWTISMSNNNYWSYNFKAFRMSEKES